MSEKINLGYETEDYSISESGKERPKKIVYPTLTLQKFPKELLSDHDTGDKVRLEIEVNIAEQVKREKEDYDGAKERVELEVMSMQYIGKGGKATRKEFEQMSEDEREKYQEESIGVSEK